MLLGALVIVGLAIFTALKIADRLVRPVGQLVDAAGRVEEGDFSARVPVAPADDEIAMLAPAFNRMTGRLQEQTGALIAANDQLDTRRAFIEAVLSSVTAGVVALDAERPHPADQPLGRDPARARRRGRSRAQMLGRRLARARRIHGRRGARGQCRWSRAEGGQRTLAVKRVRYADGAVLTFDDITDQLSDQRRAAWSDIARRIAHEIKNPLTPIQLAAERLQRRYGEEVTSDPETFERLTGTIVRQVGDLRRMVDEFSNFARMPKPVFQRRECPRDRPRGAVPARGRASRDQPSRSSRRAADIRMVCDRRQLGQALTNVVKNAVEAIEARRNRGETNFDGDRVDLRCAARRASSW